MSRRPQRFTLTMADYCDLHADYVALRARAGELEAASRPRCAVPGCELGHWHSGAAGVAAVIDVTFPGLADTLRLPICDHHHGAVTNYARPEAGRLGDLIVDAVALVIQQAQTRPRRAA